MRRGLVHAFAWLLATGAAVTLSWWGVHSVMSGTAYDPPLAVPLAPDALSSATQRPPTAAPEPSPSGSPSAGASPPAPGATPGGQPSVSPSPKASGGPGSLPAGQDAADRSGDAGRVKAYTAAGGRVVFDLGASSADLVQATPEAGWQMQVWKQPYWIRVTFTKGDREVSVFCTWHSHPPLVETYEN
ncbi:hypothetical protein SUDANB120_02295 [Streptomyces sp. enrichment culture]|uniref:hypothetical protein n=1 Tax=Streptomyces sp. enrichment culture TaxID=1795815 RepID=UPI003F555FEA